MAQEEFQSPYKFRKDEVTVVLQHHMDKNIRVGKDDDKLGSNGGFGKFARWKVSIKKEDDDLIALFQSEHSGDYLRIMKDGEDINAGGKGKGLCEFKVHRISSGVVKLESMKVPGAYIAVSKDGDVKVGKGGPLCRIEALKEGAPEKFSKPYKFAKENTVVIEHRDEKNVRVKPGETEQVDTEGGKGQLAQWKAIPSEDGKVVQFQSLKTEGFLRIKNDGEVDADGKGKGLTFFKVHQVGAKNEVRLESQKHDGKFLVFQPQKQTLGAGDDGNRKSIFHIFRED